MFPSPPFIVLGWIPINIAQTSKCVTSRNCKNLNFRKIYLQLSIYKDLTILKKKYLFWSWGDTPQDNSIHAYENASNRWILQLFHLWWNLLYKQDISIPTACCLWSLCAHSTSGKHANETLIGLIFLAFQFLYW